MSMLIRREGSEWVLENSLYLQKLQVTPGQGLDTVSLIDKVSGTEYVQMSGYEFRFMLDAKWYFPGNVPVESASVSVLPDGGEMLDITCVIPEKLTVTVRYMIWPDLPGVRKELVFTGLREQSLIERLMIHETGAAPAKFGDCDFYSGAEFRLEPVNFIHDGDEELLVCHDPAGSRGWMMASAVPGSLRFMMGYSHWRNVSAGYSQGATPFARYLKKDELFQTDPVFFSLYSGEVGNLEARQTMAELIRRALPRESFGNSVMYCTWIPFLLDINEEIVLRQIEAAGKLGFGHFVLDDGWFVPGSNWAIDREKFPNGLGVVADGVHAAGMKFGIWFNIGTDYGMKMPEQSCYVRESSGRIKMLGSNRVRCPASSHRDLMLEKLSELVETYAVDYFKLDFSMVGSPYGVIPHGCHCREHEYHHGFEDSALEMFRGLEWLRNELKKRYPELLIDFSFESMGTAKPNVAGLRYSDIQHVSNLNALHPEFQSIERVRKTFYRWIGVLPPERILHGLLALVNERAPEYVLTSFCGAPLLAGDFAQLDEKILRRISGYIATYRRIAASGVLTGFEVLAAEPDFDGFRRFDAAGCGFACYFNRTASPRETPYGRVPGNECVLFEIS